MAITEELIFPAGTIVKLVKNGRVYYVRADACRQFKATYGENTQVTFSGYRVRPNNFNVTFGSWHSYTGRSTDIHVAREA